MIRLRHVETVSSDNSSVYFMKAFIALNYNPFASLVNVMRHYAKSQEEAV